MLDAVALRRNAMADKNSFTAQEWTLLLESVMAAGMAVSMADPGGLWGLLKEGFASGEALVKAKVDPGTNSLIKAVVADLESGPGRGTAKQDLQTKFASTAPADVKATCIEILRQASALLDAKASGDAVAFKTWLGKISQGVAEAAKEGGFLGIGGVPVSDAEKATLAEISRALKI
jgi:hypothetical protein